MSVTELKEKLETYKRQLKIAQRELLIAQEGVSHVSHEKGWTNYRELFQLTLNCLISLLFSIHIHLID